MKIEYDKKYVTDLGSRLVTLASDWKRAQVEAKAPLLLPEETAIDAESMDWAIVQAFSASAAAWLKTTFVSVKTGKGISLSEAYMLVADFCREQSEHFAREKKPDDEDDPIGRIGEPV